MYQSQHTAQPASSQETHTASQSEQNQSMSPEVNELLHMLKVMEKNR